MVFVAVGQHSLRPQSRDRRGRGRVVLRRIEGVGRYVTAVESSLEG